MAEMSAPPIPLPAGFVAGHHTDPEGWTGCTVIVAPDGSVGSGEVRGGGPGSRESDLLSPATSTDGPQAVLLTGGSAFGLAAADGVVAWLAEAGRGHPTPAGPVPLVAGAVVFDLMLGAPTARPDAAAGRAACAAAGPDVARGSVGAGTGATVGKLLGPEHWTKGGLGAASVRAGEATIVAIAVANPVGDVLGEDGDVIAGAWRAGRYERTVDLLSAGLRPPIDQARTNTTLVCLCTDARLTKTQAWVVARAASAGVARAVSPCATAFDGDMTFVLASGAVEADPLILGALAAEATSAAIRDAVRSADGAPGCPSAADRRTPAATRITEIGAIFVPVADQDRALAFYVGTLGFEKRVDFVYGDDERRWVEVAPPGAANTIALVPPSEGASTGGDAAYCAFATTDIEADHAALSAAGADVDPGIGRTGTRRPGLVALEASVGDPVPAQFFFRDPDGNRFLIVQP
jgi:L-aminopeptidase/D-esterase-like protein/catechol 2,3-dioxygenase-like lactoylglutathione lyase family enzyme